MIYIKQALVRKAKKLFLSHSDYYSNLFIYAFCKDFPNINYNYLNYPNLFI